MYLYHFKACIFCLFLILVKSHLKKIEICLDVMHHICLNELIGPLKCSCIRGGMAKPGRAGHRSKLVFLRNELKITITWLIQGSWKEEACRSLFWPLWNHYGCSRHFDTQHMESEFLYLWNFQHELDIICVNKACKAAKNCSLSQRRRKV